MTAKSIIYIVLPGETLAPSNSDVHPKFTPKYFPKKYEFRLLDQKPAVTDEFVNFRFCPIIKRWFALLPLDDRVHCPMCGRYFHQYLYFGLSPSRLHPSPSKKLDLRPGSVFKPKTIPFPMKTETEYRFDLSDVPWSYTEKPVSRSDVLSPFELEPVEPMPTDRFPAYLGDWTRVDIQAPKPITRFYNKRKNIWRNRLPLFSESPEYLKNWSIRYGSGSFTRYYVSPDGEYFPEPPPPPSTRPKPKTFLVAVPKKHPWSY